MSTYLVRFSDVGRRKASWTEEFQQPPPLPALARIARKKAPLMSHDVDCLMSEDGKNGTVYAGVRAVGYFTVEVSA
jgi:hypothetical protein